MASSEIHSNVAVLRTLSLKWQDIYTNKQLYYECKKHLQHICPQHNENNLSAERCSGETFRKSRSVGILWSLQHRPACSYKSGAEPPPQGCQTDVNFSFLSKAQVGQAIKRKGMNKWWETLLILAMHQFYKCIQGILSGHLNPWPAIMQFLPFFCSNLKMTCIKSTEVWCNK